METTAEEWRPIPDTDGQYSVSSLGRVRSEPMPGRSGRQRGRILKPYPDRKGYPLFSLCLTSRKRLTSKVHRAVAAAFLGPRPEGMQVNHKDGDKTNNRPENLEYRTGLDNIRHSWATGLHANDDRKGESGNLAKLTDDDVRAIRAATPPSHSRHSPRSTGLPPRTSRAS